MAKSITPPKKFKVGHLAVRPLLARKRPATVAPDVWYWQVLSYKDGKQFVAWSGWATQKAVTETAARLVVEKRGDGRGEKAQGPNELTVQDLLELWSADFKKGCRKPNTVKSRMQQRVHLERVLGQVLLVRLSDADVQDYVRTRLAEPKPKQPKPKQPNEKPATYGELTVWNELTCFSIAWKWGRARGLTPDRKTPRAAFKPKTHKPYTPPDADVPTVIEALETPWHRLALRIQVATGMRIGEVLSLRWDEIDEEHGLIRLTDGAGRKTGGRELAYSPSLAPVLAAIPKEQRRHYVVPLQRVVRAEGAYTLVEDAEAYRDERSLGVSDSAVNSCLRYACKRLGVKVYTTHAIRRVVENAWIDSGADIRTFAAQFGHSPETALKHYGEATPQRKTRAAARVDVMAAPRGGDVIAFPGRRTGPDHAT